MGDPTLKCYSVVIVHNFDILELGFRICSELGAQLTRHIASPIESMEMSIN